MKIIINTSNLYVGGGVQVALSFINELRLIATDHQYLIVLSPEIKKQIEPSTFSSQFQFILVEKSPASLKTRIKIVSLLDKIEERFKPDVVFSVFGPSYWRPKAKHIMGFALPWIAYPNSIVYSKMPLFKRWKAKIANKYRSYYILRDSNFYVVETTDVKIRLKNILNIVPEKVAVIGNTYSSVFEQKDHPIFEMPNKDKNVFRMVTISHNYAHKNLQIITKVIPYLKNAGVKFQFVVTIDEMSYKKLFYNYSSYVLNIGPIETKYCPSIYLQSDALFLPTLLECFSASYPEAMKMHRPILTSNYSFAKDICKNAALYFDPLDPKDISDKIINLSLNEKLRTELVSKGTEVLSTFETAGSRAQKYIQLCEQISYN